MSEASIYVESLQFHDRVIMGRTEGLDQADSMLQLPFPGNCLNWNLGHLLVFRDRILGMIDGQSDADEAEYAVYGAGSEPLTDSDKAIPIATLLSRLKGQTATITAAIEAMPPDRLDQIIDEERGLTVRERLDFYVRFHEAYHIGQLELLRELALASRQAA